MNLNQIVYVYNFVNLKLHDLTLETNAVYQALTNQCILDSKLLCVNQQPAWDEIDFKVSVRARHCVIV